MTKFGQWHYKELMSALLNHLLSDGALYLGAPSALAGGWEMGDTAASLKATCWHWPSDLPLDDIIG